MIKIGYDCHVVDKDGQTLPESLLDVTMDSTDAQWDAEMDRRADSHTYLRRSGGNMGALIFALEAAGMGYEAVGKPEFPTYPGDEHFDENYQPITEQGRAHRERSQWVLRHTFDERPGIPLHKFSTNDGWWVTRAECHSALQLWAKAGSPMYAAFRDDVIPFLLKASQNGGFCVH